MKSRQFLITVYYEEPENQNEFVRDINESLAEEGVYEYELCITKVISDHLVSANFGNEVRIFDVALDSDPERIQQLITNN